MARRSATPGPALDSTQAADPLAGDGGRQVIRWLATAALCIVILGIGWIDYVTGPDVGFALFYLLPILVAGLWIGRAAAAVTAITASLTWFAADVALVGPAKTWLSAWHGFTRLIIFLIIGIGAALLRCDRERLRQLLSLSETAARTDTVTGLPNLRAFLEATRTEFARAQRDRQSLCIAYIDLDDFKKVNDLFGHSEGNALLERIGEQIRATVRTSDLPARVGGDEFAILLWRVDIATGRAIAERLVDEISRLRRDYPGTELGASIGVIHFATPPDDLNLVLQAADAVMYEAKESGKGRVVVRRVAGGRLGTAPVADA